MAENTTQTNSVNVTDPYTVNVTMILDVTQTYSNNVTVKSDVTSMNFTTIPDDASVVLDSIATRTIEGLFVSIICVVALFGNLSLWIVILKTRHLRKEANYLLLCLSSADILVSLGMPITCITIVSGDWMFSEDLCVGLGFINMVTFISSVMSLGVISLNRYFKICKPHQYSTIYTTRNIFLMVAGVWALASALALPPLIGWGKYGFLSNQSFCFCDWSTSLSYTFFMVGVCFGGPCTVMTISYVCILRTLRESSRKVLNSISPDNAATVSKQAAEPTISCDDSSKTHIIQDDDISEGKQSERVGGKYNTNRISTISDVHPIHIRTSAYLSCDPPAKSSRLKTMSRKQKRRQEEIRITALFLVVIFAFVLSWLPFCIAMFLSVLTDNYSVRNFDMFTLLLGYANSCYNPFIYGILNQRVKQGYKTVFANNLPKCCKSKVKPKSERTA